MMFLVLSVSGVCSVMKSARRKSVIELDLLDAKLGGALLRQKRIEGDDAHLQAERAARHHRSDVAAADDAEHLSGDLDAHEARLLPLPRLRRLIGRGNLPGAGEEHGDRMLGRGDRIPERGVHHDDAGGGRRGDVDVVDADAGAADHAQPSVRGGDHLRRHLGGGADGEPIELADHFGELLLVGAELGLEFDIDATLAKDVDGGLRQGIGNEHTRVHGSRPSGAEDARD